jgi:hypothetical protein
MSVLQDLRFGVRMLLKDRWFTATAAIVLALGIGANNAVFTLVNAVLLRSLPFEQSQQIMMVLTRDARGRTWACRSPTSRIGASPRGASRTCRSCSAARST